MQEPLIPAPLSRITAQVADELAVTFDDQVVFPHEIVIDEPGASDRHFPGWPTPVLLISVENQGVCAWGVPLNDPNPPVVVGGELSDGNDTSDRTVRYATSVDAFIAARRWDRACMSDRVLLQAQAAELDPASLAYLRSRFEERPSSTGWPAVVTYRFQDAHIKIMLWAGDQCDWFISGTDPSELESAARELSEHCNLRTVLWSNHPDGETLLDRIRDRS